MFLLDELNRVMRMDYPTNRIIRWQPAHLYMCQLNAFDEANLKMFGDFHEYLETYASTGHAFTGMSGDDVMVMFGVWQLWPGVAEAWLIPHAKIERKSPQKTLRALRLWVLSSEKKNGKIYENPDQLQWPGPKMVLKIRDV